MLRLVAVQLGVELGVQHVPPSRPRLGRASSFLDNNRLFTEPGQQRETHGNSVVVVWVNTRKLRNLQIVVVNTVDGDTILELLGLHAKLGELDTHGLNTVALLHTLVGNTDDRRRLRVVGNSCNHRRRQECIGHWLHINQRKRLQATNWGSLYGGGSLCLSNSASHWSEHVGSKPRVSLQRRRSNVRNRALGSVHSSKCKRISGRRGIALNNVLGRVNVMGLWNMVGVLLGRGFGHVNAERAHHSDGHVDVQLRNWLTSHQRQGDRLIGVGSANQNRRDILGRNSGLKLDSSSLESLTTLNLQRKRTNIVLILDVGSVGLQSVHKRTDWSLLHPAVSCENDTGEISINTNQGCNRSQEPRGCSCISKVNLLLTSNKVTTVSVQNKGFSLVLPRNLGSFQCSHRGQHVSSVIGMKQVLDTANTFTQGSHHQSTVRDRFGSRWSDYHLGRSSSERFHENVVGQNDSKILVVDIRCLWLVALSNALQQHNLLLGTVVLLVHSHLLQQKINRTLLAVDSGLHNFIL
ncbi:hypothetical protein OGAPHI_006803 [Ogataea philodendri]|uniref:Uncharacterized protein n=1 Tax=Ogataea philodendri TaxID=1378263 RepID=A0A9P8T0F8_9ASCO|nr:uncharacterized protein OGAPHI_006803 [Ogataea philodendri]KAH3661396.1 hypothetical protein OGAPHI_006803 [Ogataea philodendri]